MNPPPDTPDIATLVTSLVEELRGVREQLAAAQLEITALREENATLRARVAELEEAARKNSTNSSKPPSSDPPGTQRKKKPKSKKKRGAQPGHAGNARVRVSPERVDVRRVHKIQGACTCGCAETTTPKITERRHSFEIPVIRPTVTEDAVESARCKNCNARRRGTLPPDVPTGCLGPRAQALVATLTGTYGMSRRDAERALSELFDLDISLGTISNTEARVSEALAPVHADAVAAIQEAPVVNADETGCARAGQHTTAWVATTLTLAAYLVGETRGREAMRRLLGDNFPGIVGSDRYVVYAAIPPERRQLCLEHIRRAFVALSESNAPVAARVGAALTTATVLVLRSWRELKQGRIDRTVFDQRATRARSQLEWLLAKHRGLPKMRTIAHAFWLTPASIWQFTTTSGVEPTNNIAERDLRCLVTWRRTSHGTQSARGDRFIERALTVSTSCRKQGRNLFAFMLDAVRAARGPLIPPSLRPLALLEASSGTQPTG